MWTVQVVTGADKRASIRANRFETKRLALEFIRKTPHSFIGRLGQTYTIYAKAGGK